MAQSVLMVYEDLSSLKESDYWTKYIKFYEKYWDGTATPQSSWWGQEYDNFRESLSGHLGMDKNHVKDCFFMKNNDGNYFVCPIGSEVNLNILAVENIIPFEWFLLFHSGEKNYFYTHTGFGAVHHDSIYYTSDINDSFERIIQAEKIVTDFINNKSENLGKYENLTKLDAIIQGIINIKDWLSGFGKKGKLILNYGEISNHIIQESMKNEDSVGQLWNILKDLENGNTDRADNDLKFLELKWVDISRSASGINPETSISLQ